jgi:hypothetical protein
MLDERSLRRPWFQDGAWVRLADGNLWSLPLSGSLRENQGELAAAGPTLTGLIEAVFESEDRAELRRMELALAIHLLGCNYQLGPTEYQSLLDFPPNSPLLLAAQEAFHAVALDHAACLLPRPCCAVDRRPTPVASRLAFLFKILRPLI